MSAVRYALIGLTLFDLLCGIGLAFFPQEFFATFHLKFSGVLPLLLARW